MWIKALALAVLLAVLWRLFRLSMGLRWAKVSREEARREEEGRGRQVVAELPSGADGTLGFFTEDHAGFYWPGGEAGKPALRGGRLLLNRGVVASAARPGEILPDPPPAESFEGRERWQVVLYLSRGEARTVECGAVREGVSREIAARVFDRVRAALGGQP